MITNSKNRMNCETESELTFLYNLIKNIERTVKDQEQEIKDLKKCLNMKKKDQDFNEENTKFKSGDKRKRYCDE